MHQLKNINDERKSQVLISVLIPTCNCAKWIAQAIDSVLSQDYDNLEIIVVDDGSTDNTREIVECYGKPVKYFYKENGGISSSRNACLREAKGEYIAWLDADDYWAKGKLQAQVKYFEEHPDCEIVFTGYKNFIENEEIKYQANVQKELDLEQRYKHYLPSALIKKEVFEKCGIFREDFPKGEDADWLFRLKTFTGVNMKNYIENIYYFRRLHGNNITLNSINNPAQRLTGKYVIQTIRNKMHNQK
jgi:glycosyltransferase involved in cell wall biosynthesis